MILLNKMEMHIIHIYKAVTCSFDCILCFRSPHYACPEVIRVSWLTLVYKYIFLKCHSLQVHRQTLCTGNLAKADSIGKDTRNVTTVLFVWLSPESSYIDSMREMIVCYSHSTLRAMWSDRNTVASFNLIFPPRGCSPLRFPVSAVAVISVEEPGLPVSDVGFH